MTLKSEFKSSPNNSDFFVFGTMFGIAIGVAFTLAVGRIALEHAVKDYNNRVQATTEDILSTQLLKQFKSCNDVKNTKVDSVRTIAYRDYLSPDVVIIKCEKDGIFNGAASVSGYRPK